MDVVDLQNDKGEEEHVDYAHEVRLAGRGDVEDLPDVQGEDHTPGEGPDDEHRWEHNLGCAVPLQLDRSLQQSKWHICKVMQISNHNSESVQVREDEAWVEEENR